MTNNNNFCILYGKKDDNLYYIANTNPVIWNPDIREAKCFFNRYIAECAVLRDYDNYNYFMKMIKSNVIHNIYVIEYLNGNEIGRHKIL